MVKHVHFLGIGGSGASAAAAIAQAQGLPAGRQGFKITGCDLTTENEFTTHFNKSQLIEGHSPAHLEGIDILAVTPAIFSLDANNPELLEAKKKNIPILTWQQFVGQVLTKEKFVIAVAGTHGKSTTTAMIANILEDANLDPTVLFGAIHPKWVANFRIGKSKYFVIEADEYNDNFLYLNPEISVVTNIEMDHPEYFKSFEDYKKSFTKFKKQSKEVLDKPNPNLINFPLNIPGRFNIENASLAFQVGLALGIDSEIIKKSLANYKGIGRRFEYIGEHSGAKVYSDFGHHPTEIRETLKAAREKFPDQRIILIYQPHMFTRTKYLFDDFVKVFKEITARPAELQRSGVDKVFIIDIYQSREKDLGEVSSKQLAEGVEKESVKYIGKPSEVLQKLKPIVKNGDVLFFMSAGDTDYLAKKLVFNT